MILVTGGAGYIGSHTCVELLNAGHEATVHAIGNAAKAFLELGLRDGIGEGHVEEALRYDAPLHLFTRYALEDLDYNGLRLRKGEVVGLLGHNGAGKSTLINILAQLVIKSSGAVSIWGIDLDRRPRDAAKIIKGEIHNVLTVMRSDPR